eukprot:366095-Chlamydomonas_euryale.AAC.14
MGGRREERERGRCNILAKRGICNKRCGRVHDLQLPSASVCAFLVCASRRQDRQVNCGAAWACLRVWLRRVREVLRAGCGFFGGASNSRRGGGGALRRCILCPAAAASGPEDGGPGRGRGLLQVGLRVVRIAVYVRWLHGGALTRRAGRAQRCSALTSSRHLSAPTACSVRCQPASVRTCWRPHLRKDPVGDVSVAVAARRVGVVGQQLDRVLHGSLERKVLGDALERHCGWSLIPERVGVLRHLFVQGRTAGTRPGREIAGEGGAGRLKKSSQGRCGVRFKSLEQRA